MAKNARSRSRRIPEYELLHVRSTRQRYWREAVEREAEGVVVQAMGDDIEHARWAWAGANLTFFLADRCSDCGARMSFYGQLDSINDEIASPMLASSLFSSVSIATK